MRVLTIVGARPQFVKAAVVSRALRGRHTEVLVHTGQHYDRNMSDVFFEDLDLPQPARHLGIGSGAHGEQTGRMLIAIEAVLFEEKPDLVLVYGDTNSTLAGALAAAKLHIPIAHVEAGCRSYDRRMAEEMNRVLTDHLSTWLLCATRTAATNLEREGLRDGIHVVGDVMLDLCRARLPTAERSSTVRARLALGERDYAVATIHRAENTDDPQRLAMLIDALGHVGMPVVFPVHPRTRAALAGIGLPSNVRAIDPLGYLDMLVAVRHARTVVTDSGGLQKEALFLETPCVTVRSSTEWPETVATGWNVCVDSGSAGIASAVRAARPPRAASAEIFGDGQAAAKIVACLEAPAR
jgi:UDP-N-acetylglucosamine 2-epimerase